MSYRLNEVAMNLAIACGVHEQSAAFEIIRTTLDNYADERLEDFTQFLARADIGDWRRWSEAARDRR